ncbi:MAG: hypothetical protein HC896_12870, partial [Bacteroidales bacterium]|nr:hypothetical protein [Bacteroidales bacterium]
DLKYRNKDDIQLKVKAIGISGNNTRTEVEAGDADGELRTLFFYNIQSKAELEQRAMAELQKIKFDGYQGSLSTFHVPFVTPGNTVEIKDPMFADRSGKYHVDSVKTTWGVSGARRKVEIGIKVD